MSYVCPHCGASATGTMAETWAWDKNHRTECTERPTPAPTLETRIAEVLGAHQWYDATTDNEDPATGCTSCDDWYGDEDAVDDGTFARHQAEMLAPVIAEAQAEASAQAFQAVRDNAEHEPEERDGPHLIMAAYLMIDVDKLNHLDKYHDGMDWVRFTATDYANSIREREAEAWGDGALASYLSLIHGDTSTNPYHADNLEKP